MEFWYLLFSIIWTACTITLFLPNKYAIYILYMVIFIVWIVGAFRCNIGSDYSVYENIYDSWIFYGWDLLNFEGWGEPSFWVIVCLLNELNFSSQMFFFVYETITLFFLYRGICYYTENRLIVLVVLVMYVFYPAQGGYWWSFCFVRQAAAMSIVFWGTKYLCQKDYLKFMLIIFTGVMIHFSAVFMLIILLFKYKINTHKVYFALVIGFILNAMSLSSVVIMRLAEVLINFTGRYTTAYLMSEAGTVSFSAMAFVLSVIYFIANKYITDKNMVIIHNGAAIYILLRVYMSFGIEGSALASVTHRFEVYFLFFYLLLIAFALRNFVNLNNRIIANGLVGVFLLMFAFMGWNRIHQEEMVIDTRPTVKSSGNIQYEFNFNLYR